KKWREDGGVMWVTGWRWRGGDGSGVVAAVVVGLKVVAARGGECHSGSRGGGILELGRNFGRRWWPATVAGGWPEVAPKNVKCVCVSFYKMK
nr:hypothetical protein [Tanacetum cinerariifolium]